MKKHGRENGKCIKKYMQIAKPEPKRNKNSSRAHIHVEQTHRNAKLYNEPLQKITTITGEDTRRNIGSGRIATLFLQADQNSWKHDIHNEQTITCETCDKNPNEGIAK